MKRFCHGDKIYLYEVTSDYHHTDDILGDDHAHCGEFVGLIDRHAKHHHYTNLTTDEILVVKMGQFIVIETATINQLEHSAGIFVAKKAQFTVAGKCARTPGCSTLMMICWQTASTPTAHPPPITHRRRWCGSWWLPCPLADLSFDPLPTAPRSDCPCAIATSPAV